MIHLSLLSTLVLAQGHGFAGMSRGPEDFVVTEKQAYLVLPPQAVGDGQIAFFKWSPSGRYLLMGKMSPILNPALVRGMIEGRQPPEPKMSLMVWDKSDGKTTSLGQLSEPLFEHSFEWMPDADVAVAPTKIELPTTNPDSEFAQVRYELLRIDLRNSSVRRIPISISSQFADVSLRPVPAMKSLFVLQTGVPHIVQGGAPATHQHRGALLDLEGRLGPAFTIPGSHIQGVKWKGDGSIAEFAVLRFQPGQQGTVQPWLYDLRKGAEIPANASLPDYKLSQTAEPELEILGVVAQAQAGAVKTNMQTVWLRSRVPSEQTELLLSPRAQNAELSPTADAVAILDLGVVSVRQLAKVPKEVFLQARNAALRSRLVNQAKQVALGLIMYAGDTDDDILPGQGEWSGAIAPYLKNESLLQGFTYTFKGGSINSIENPAATMLGYVQGPGGYAVAFADGHVKWLPELPKT